MSLKRNNVVVVPTAFSKAASVPDLALTEKINALNGRPDATAVGQSNTTGWIVEKIGCPHNGVSTPEVRGFSLIRTGIRARRI
jgi:hypothetical protein